MLASCYRAPPIFQKTTEHLSELLGLFGLTFPDDEHIPTLTFKSLDVRSVSALISVELLSPELLARFWDADPPAARLGMTVPKATVNKYQLPKGAKHQVGMAG